MDNYFQSCPPKMNDQGRPLTDFHSSTVRDEYLKMKYGICRDDEFRHFLQTNANQLMDLTTQYHMTHNRCWVNDCVHNNRTRVSSVCMANEMRAYNSIFNPNTHARLQQMRQCHPGQNFFLNHES